MAAPLIKRLLDERPLLDEIQSVYEVVRKRAYELYRDDGSRSSIDNWLQAERETFWKPPVELITKDDSYIVQTRVPGLDAAHLDIQVSKGWLVIKGETVHDQCEQDSEAVRCDHSCEKLFREVELPQDADFDSASAKLDNDLLIVTFSRDVAPQRKSPAAKTSAAKAPASKIQVPIGT